jgi:hypothetical protein
MSEARLHISSNVGEPTTRRRDHIETESRRADRSCINNRAASIDRIAERMNNPG